MHPAQFWLNSTEIPETSPVQLNTHDLDKAFPGIADYYGSNQTVNVFVNITNLYDFTVTAGDEQVALNGDLRFQFYVDTIDGAKDLAVDLSLDKMIMEASILIDGFNVNGNFTKLKVQNVVVNTCSFGKLSTFKLKMELNVGLAVAAGPINKKLSGLVIPSEVLGIFELSDLVIDYYDGFLMAGATPTFIAP